MRLRSRSLVGRLSRRLVLLQFLALALVMLVASIPDPGREGVANLDSDVLVAIASHLELQGDRLVLRDADRLASRMSDDPGFWYLAGDMQGRTSEYGPVPDAVRQVFGNPGLLAHAEIYGEGGDGVLGNLIARRFSGPDGPLTVISGAGPTLPQMIGQLQRIDPLNALLFITLMIALALTIPWLLRRDLSGVAKVAAEAERIDIDQPGTRLPEADVPTELRGMVRAMNAALLRLDEGLEERRRFLATAAHELRTPIAILSMRIEMLQPGPERHQLMLDVARLSSLTDQLLDLERFDAGHIHPVRTDLRVVAGEAMADIAPLAISAGADLSLSAPEAPLEILADPQAIRRVLINLIQNAIAHGGTGVAIAVEIAAPADIRVRDDGPGIRQDDRDRVFEPFFRRQSGAGSGLGLHLVREIVTRHGGTVHLLQAPAQGAEFVLRFPPAPD